MDTNHTSEDPRRIHHHGSPHHTINPRVMSNIYHTGSWAGRISYNIL